MVNTSSLETQITIFWFRRDLRLEDNIGFHYALEQDKATLPIFIFDTEILEELPEDDARVTFIYDRVEFLRKELQNHGSSLAIYKGKPIEIFRQLLLEYDIQGVVANRDYEPYAIDRDSQIKDFLSEKNIPILTFKDHVIFEQNEVVKSNGEPYVVYTPYMKLWKSSLKTLHTKSAGPNQYNILIKDQNLPNLSLEDIGFKRSSIQTPKFNIEIHLIDNYEARRNFPYLESTSLIGPHLRFGTISIRKVVALASISKNDTFLKELIWREFFIQILWHFPKTTTNAFKSKYDRIKWRNNTTEFDLWKKGLTGYPMVDAGMRELNTTGFMHNRVRMVVASFLCKHLLIDWRWGEAYFAEKLLDYEQASNVGNWQWAAGSGVDAAPYFRIFNPSAQLDKFDKNQEYVKKWVPELLTEYYPKPLVDHKMARERCLSAYKLAVS